MEPEHMKFGGGAAHTAFNPVILLIVIIFGIFVCFGGRKQAISLFLASTILVPLDQVLVIGPLHFPMLRVILLFGMVRMIRAKFTPDSDIFSGGITRLDKVVILFAVVTAVNSMLLWRDAGMLVKLFGDLYTVFGIYFLLRYLIRDESDADKAVRSLVYITVIVAIVMSYEQLTGHNPYALLGGAQAAFYGSSITREDRLRAVAGFGHPILAGTFGAILVPLFVGLWLKDRKNFKIALTGFVASSVVMFASASSTPILAYGAGLLAICLWPLRERMRLIRWGIVITLISLHMVMKAPVWQLIDRLDIVGGSSGYHRYQLVDQCIRHFGDWWLYGVKETGSWGWDMWDTANQYVAVADTTGLIPFILFVAIIVYAFKYVGAARKLSEANKNEALYFWSLGGAVLANAVGFFGITYWDQTQVVWLALLAIIVARTQPVLAMNLSPGAKSLEQLTWRLATSEEQCSSSDVFSDEKTRSVSTPNR